MSLRTCLPLLAATIAVWPLFGRAADAASTERLSGPVVHENIALYFVHGPSAPGAVPQTLQEALAKGTVEVHETGNVQELRIENKGKEAVFVQSGDIVKGGRQDRVLTVSLLLAPNSGAVPVGSFCVEQGRWSARGGEDAKKFALSEALMPSREAKVAIARRVMPSEPANPVASTGTRRQTAELPETSLAEQRARQSPPRAEGQGEVWRSVGLIQQQLAGVLAAPVASDKSRTSLQLSLENEKLKQAQSTLIAAIEPAGLAGDDIVGVVVAVNGRISGADVYPSNGLFRKMWPKIANAVAVEGLAASAKGEKQPAPAIEVAKDFLADAEGGSEAKRDLDGVGSVLAKESPKALSVRSMSAKGDVVHRNYVAK